MTRPNLDAIEHDYHAFDGPEHLEFRIPELIAYARELERWESMHAGTMREMPDRIEELEQDNVTWQRTYSQVEDQNTQFSIRIKELEDALRPFADVYKDIMTSTASPFSSSEFVRTFYRMFQRASNALRGTTG